MKNRREKHGYESRTDESSYRIGKRKEGAAVRARNDAMGPAPFSPGGGRGTMGVPGWICGGGTPPPYGRGACPHKPLRNREAESSDGESRREPRQGDRASRLTTPSGSESIQSRRNPAKGGNGPAGAGKPRARSGWRREAVPRRNRRRDESCRGRQSGC